MFPRDREFGQQASWPRFCFLEEGGRWVEAAWEDAPATPWEEGRRVLYASPHASSNGGTGGIGQYRLQAEVLWCALARGIRVRAEVTSSCVNASPHRGSGGSIWETRSPKIVRKWCCMAFSSSLGDIIMPCESRSWMRECLVFGASWREAWNRAAWVLLVSASCRRRSTRSCLLCFPLLCSTFCTCRICR